MMQTEPVRRPNWKWWVLVAFCVLIPPLGIVIFLADWVSRKLRDRPLMSDEVFSK
jgi:hypothetical protein